MYIIYIMLIYYVYIVFLCQTKLLIMPFFRVGLNKSLTSKSSVINFSVENASCKELNGRFILLLLFTWNLYILSFIKRSLKCANIPNNTGLFCFSHRKMNQEHFTPYFSCQGQFFDLKISWFLNSQSCGHKRPSGI